MRLDAEYVLPIRWDDDRGLAELTSYLGRLAHWVDVTIVDGSPPERFAVHGAAWSALAQHLRPDAPSAGNGKVAGVTTGLRVARHDRVVIADDDVRYDARTLGAVVTEIGRYDVVRPQNVFTAWPWHARWDTARSLLNRAWGADYPGTLGVRRATVLDAGGYRGDVLFENLELIRTIRAVGGQQLVASDLYVGRVPPSATHFVGQRVRQAYDNFAQPTRLVWELAWLPAIVWALFRPRRVVALAALAVAIAEVGRWRGEGRRVYPASSALWAPLWVAERAICMWLAVAARLRGGVRYGDGRLRDAATPPRVLRRQLSNYAVKEPS